MQNEIFTALPEAEVFSDKGLEENSRTKKFCKGGEDERFYEFNQSEINLNAICLDNSFVAQHKKEERLIHKKIKNKKTKEKNEAKVGENCEKGKKEGKDWNYRQCTKCSKVVLKKNFYLHCRVHSNLKLHMCDICGMCFKYKKVLEGHKRTHTGDKPYLCNTCGKTFATSSRLSQHSSLHSGKKPHACNYCTRAFRTKSDLDRHTRSHTGEKPYVCAFCGKGFSHSWNLREHTRRHTGELPYVCTFCFQGFKRNNFLQEHLRTVHKNEDRAKENLGNEAFSRQSHI